MSARSASTICISILAIGLALFFAVPGLARRRAERATFSVITVDTTADDDIVNGNCTLREAIMAANGDTAVDACAAGSGTDTIAFAIPGAGPHTIALASSLPEITAPVLLDGTTQPGASCTTAGGLKIELKGAGLRVTSGGSTIKGLVINGAPSSGVDLSGNGGNTVQCNYIGTDVSGTMAMSNDGTGVWIVDSPNNQIGGAGAGEGNLISGNIYHGIFVGGTTATGNRILGNHIGVNAVGDAAIGNGLFGVAIGNDTPDNVIGGTAAGARNVISGNRAGITIATPGASGTQILGNYIGTNAAGTAALGNLEIGIAFEGDNTVVGGTTPGARNIISGNGGVGIQGSGNNLRVQGNYIGTDVTGTIALPHSREGIFFGGANALIGGTTAAARNLISGNGGAGIGLAFNATNNRVQGNYIGTNASGTASLPNGGGVVMVEGAHDNLIGGTTAGARNVISGNTYWGLAFYIRGNNNIAQGNFIGLNAAGTAPVPNGGHGVLVIISSGNTVGGSAVGAANRIAYNDGAGISVVEDADNPSANNRFSGNEIFANGALGIELFPFGVTANDAGDGDVGPNNLQNFPVLNPIAAAGTVTGSLDSAVENSAYPVRIEFFANAACDASGSGQGEVFLGATSVAGPGGFTFAYTPVSGKTFITATATDANGNTSEFSACSQQPVNAPPTIAGAALTLQKGTVNAVRQIATVGDANQPAQTLTVKINGGASATADGVTVSGLGIDAAGKVTASVSVTCDATTTTARTFSLTVTDNGNLSASAALTVTVLPNAKPVLEYSDQTVAIGGTLTVNPASGPSDNGTFVVEFDKVRPKTGIAVSVHPGTGVVSITNVTRADVYAIDINITDNCNQKISATFKLTVTASAVAKRAVRNDFDGDGKSDLFTWEAGEGTWRIERSSDEGWQVERWGAQGDMPVPMDYDGDGRTDLAVWREADGHWLIRRSSDGKTMDLQLGERGDVPVPGDYDGDGSAEPAVWHASSATWVIRFGSNVETRQLAFGSGEDVAAPGDYDGDGKLDLAVWRPASGEWLIRPSGGGEDLAIRWGLSGDVPVPADYDGDGKTDIAVWRGPLGAWLIRGSADGALQRFLWGARVLGDLPTPGDYDGDGRTDAAVWRPVEGAWYLRDAAGRLPSRRIRRD